MICLLAGCATGGPGKSADATAQAFWGNWQRSKPEKIYALFSAPMARKMSFDRFQRFWARAKEQWGSFEGADTALMPFHQFAEPQGVVPAAVPADKIKREVFEVKFSNAAVNCDLTLIPEDGQYKIAWFAFWGTGSAPQFENRI